MKNKKETEEKVYITKADLTDALLNVVTKDQLKGIEDEFAEKTHGHAQLSDLGHIHDSYAEKVHEHTEYVKLTDVMDYCKKNCASKKHSHKEYENRGVMPFDAFGIAIFFLGLCSIIAGMVLLWKLGIAMLIGGIIVFIIGIIFMGKSGSSDDEEEDDKKEDDC